MNLAPPHFYFKKEFDDLSTQTLALLKSGKGGGGESGGSFLSACSNSTCLKKKPFPQSARNFFGLTGSYSLDYLNQVRNFTYFIEEKR